VNNNASITRNKKLGLDFNDENYKEIKNWLGEIKRAELTAALATGLNAAYNRSDREGETPEGDRSARGQDGSWRFRREGRGHGRGGEGTRRQARRDRGDGADALRGLDAAGVWRRGVRAAAQAMAR
jgi:hypothetical protein